MSIQTIAPVKQALVRKLRTNPSLVAEVTGGIHEGVALTGEKPPYITYGIAYAPRIWDWTNVHARIGVDILVTSADQVQAQNLDQLISDTLSDEDLSVSGQSILLVRRLHDVSFGDVDESGHKIYQVGARYEIWADQVR